mgnify:CR=1 FL=1
MFSHQIPEWIIDPKIRYLFLSILFVVFLSFCTLCNYYIRKLKVRRQIKLIRMRKSPSSYKPPKKTKHKA